MRNFPFLSFTASLTVLRIATAIFFMAHAAMRIYLGTIPQFGAFMESKGFPFGVAWVIAITAYELIAGGLIIAGYWVRWCALGLMSIVLGGIVLIHFKLGWFVGEHGTGGMEYSWSLFVALLVVAAYDRDKHALVAKASSTIA